MEKVKYPLSKNMLDYLATLTNTRAKIIFLHLSLNFEIDEEMGKSVQIVNFTFEKTKEEKAMEARTYGF